MIRIVILLLFAKYYWSHQIKEDEMGGACRMHVINKEGI
jgi:hypothetical protein